MKIFVSLLYLLIAVMLVGIVAFGVAAWNLL